MSNDIKENVLNRLSKHLIFTVKINERRDNTAFICRHWYILRTVYYYRDEIFRKFANRRILLVLLLLFIDRILLYYYLVQTQENLLIIGTSYMPFNRNN